MNRPSPRQLADARAVIAADKKARKADRPQRLKSRAKGPRHGRVLDESYVTWLHVDLPCVACLVLGDAFPRTHIEAAHQKLNVAGIVQKRLGVRPSDLWCLPLCASHHREGPVCCDPAQTKFWAIVGLEPADVAEFCMRLYGAFEQEADGAAVIREFAALAAGQRMEITA